MFICKILDYWNKIIVVLVILNIKIEMQQYMSKLKYTKKQSKKWGIFREWDLISTSNSQFPVAGFQGCPPRHCSYMSRDTISSVKPLTTSKSLWMAILGFAS